MNARATLVACSTAVRNAAAGSFARSVARVRGARALFGSVHGIITLALANKMSPFDRSTVEAEIRFIVSAAARGLSGVGSTPGHP